MLAAESMWVVMRSAFEKVNTDICARATGKKQGIEVAGSFLLELKEKLGRRAKHAELWVLTPRCCDGEARRRREHQDAHGCMLYCTTGALGTLAYRKGHASTANAL